MLLRYRFNAEGPCVPMYEEVTLHVVVEGVYTQVIELLNDIRRAYAELEIEGLE